MKRFTAVLAVFSVSTLAVWAIFQLYTASQTQLKNDNALAKAQPAHAGAVVPVTGLESRKIAPLFDDAGRVVSDPSGTILNAGRSLDRKIAPVFDANGLVVSDPSGTIWSTGNPAAQRADVKVAPVFDASGILMSDPSGIIFASANP